MSDMMHKKDMEWTIENQGFYELFVLISVLECQTYFRRIGGAYFPIIIY